MATLRENARSIGRLLRRLASGQMHGAVLLDAEGKAIRPAILWNDTRCAAECAELEAMAPELHQVAGNLAMPGFTAPKLLCGAPSIEPEHFQRTATVLLPSDYLRYRMTGRKSPDMSDAAGTLWLDGRSATGPTLCWTSAACRVAKCRRWSKAARFPPPLTRRWLPVGG